MLFTLKHMNGNNIIQINIWCYNINKAINVIVKYEINRIIYILSVFILNFRIIIVNFLFITTLIRFTFQTKIEFFNKIHDLKHKIYEKK